MSQTNKLSGGSVQPASAVADGEGASQARFGVDTAGAPLRAAEVVATAELVEGQSEATQSHVPSAHISAATGSGGSVEYSQCLALTEHLRIGAYEVLGELGAGAMGVVYRARQPGLNRIVALKVMRSDSNSDAAYRARFKEEVQAVAQLSHPGIVQIFEVGECGGRQFFSMEYCSKGTLSAQLRQRGISPRQAADIVERLSRAMAVAHAAGIVHRDLKPGNVLIGDDDTPKVADFGTAKRLDNSNPLTASYAIIGTPSYMAPEQAHGRSKDATVKTDIYGLGAILYECVSGRPPFPAGNQAEIILQVRGRDPIRPRQLDPTLSKDLETIILKCLQKQPQDRYASAAELADDLRRFLDGRAITARRLNWLQRCERAIIRHPARTAIVLLGLVLSISAGIYIPLWLDRRRQQDQQEVTERVLGEARGVLSRALRISEDADASFGAAAIAEMEQMSSELLEARGMAKVGQDDALVHHLDTVRDRLRTRVEIIKNTGRVRFINQFSEPMSIVFQGNSLVLGANETRLLETPAGDFTYQVLQIQRLSQHRKIEGGETKTIRIYPLPDVPDLPVPKDRDTSPSKEKSHPLFE